MRKLSRVASVLIAGFIILNPLAAHAKDHITEASETLLKKNVYVDSSVSFPEASKIESLSKDSSIGFVAIPESATSNLSANTIASEIAERSNKDVVIVSVDKNYDTYGAYSKSSDSNKILEILNKNNNGNAGETIEESYSELNTVIVGSSDASTKNEKTGVLTTVFIIGGCALGTLGAFVIIALIVDRRKKLKYKVKSLEKDSETALMAQQYLRLIELSEKYSTVFSKNEISPSLIKIFKSTRELFNRLGRSKDEQKIRLSASHYEHVFKKLNEALGENNYIDIVQNPEYWDSPEARIKAIESSVRSVADDILNNIRQVNASRDLEFKVVLESLNRSIDSKSDYKEIYTEEG